MNTTAQIVQIIPILFHRMRAVGDALHKKHSVTTPMRGVMQSLFDGGSQTVPQMAAARPVSRQHIQTIVDALSERGLVKALPNPNHKRSSLIDLTEEGCELFVQMREAEAVVIGQTLGDTIFSDLETTQKVLSTFAEQLQMIIQQQKESNDDE